MTDRFLGQYWFSFRFLEYAVASVRIAQGGISEVPLNKTVCVWNIYFTRVTAQEQDSDQAALMQVQGLGIEKVRPQLPRALTQSWINGLAISWQGLSHTVQHSRLCQLCWSEVQWVRNIRCNTSHSRHNNMVIWSIVSYSTEATAPYCADMYLVFVLAWAACWQTAPLICWIG